VDFKTEFGPSMVHLQPIKKWIDAYFQKYIFKIGDTRTILLYNDVTNAIKIKQYNEINIDNTKIVIWEEQIDDIYKLNKKKVAFNAAVNKTYEIDVEKIHEIYGVCKKMKKTDIHSVFKIISIKSGFIGKNCTSISPVTSRENGHVISVDYDKYLDKKYDTQNGLCVLNEILLRLYDMNNINGKRWFLTDIEHEFNADRIKALK